MRERESFTFIICPWISNRYTIDFFRKERKKERKKEKRDERDRKNKRTRGIERNKRE